MKARAVLRLDLASEAEAETARRALEPDGGGFVGLARDGAVLVVEAEAETRLGLLRSLDDVLGCVRALGIP